VHARGVFLTQVPSLGVLGVMLAEIFAARTARRGTITLGKCRKSRAKDNHSNQKWIVSRSSVVRNRNIG